MIPANKTVEIYLLYIVDEFFKEYDTVILALA